MTNPSIMQTYNRFPITIDKGEGSYVWDNQGTKYLDFTAGIGTCNLGHVPETVKKALQAQLEKLWHCTNLYHIEQQEKVADLLTKNSGFDQVFFCNSGAEANEAAIKLIRKYKGEDKDIVTFTKSFHGRTMATLTATGQEKVKTGFYPLVPGFRYLPYNDTASLKDLANHPPAAVMLELVQGEGGVHPAKQAWIDDLVAICDKYDILLAVDEIQTGMGRTGTLFAHEQYGFTPDIMTLAKSLGSGFPVGAMLATNKVAKMFTYGSHGSTFGGNPLAMTAALATMDDLLNTAIIASAKQKAKLLEPYLYALQKQFPMIKEIRQKGLMIGLEVSIPAREIVMKALDENLLILTAGEHVVRFLPALTITEDDIALFISKLKKVFQTLQQG